MKFPKEVSDKLGYYVYRLIDPRNGRTFYVGKGKENRAFDHAKAALKFTDDEDEISEKFAIIRDILSENLEPLVVIHRHGMDEPTAMEVEAALIDAYKGIVNVQDGWHTDFGMTGAQQIIKRYSTAKENVADFSAYTGSLIIKTTEEIIEDRGSVYEAVRSCWRLSKSEAKKAKYVFAVVNGIIKGVFEPKDWENVACTKRIAFTGTEAPKKVSQEFVGKRIPEQYMKRGAVNPTMYIKAEGAEK